MKLALLIVLTGAALLWLAACREEGFTGTSDMSDPVATSPSADGGARREVLASGAVDKQSWQTYVNKDFGFSIDYPPSVTVVESRTNGHGSLLLSVRLLGPEETSPVLRDRAPGRFALAVFANRERLALAAWLDANGWPFGAGLGDASSIEIGGAAALDIATGRMLAPNRYIYVASNGVIIRMAPIGSESERILNSFRLLKAGQSSP